MSNNITSDALSIHKRQLSVIFLAYIILSITFGYNYRFAINPDGVSYLRLAGYIAEGSFSQSVAGAWAPLLTWLIAPFLVLGFDGLTSARIAIALSGGLLLFGSWLLSLRFELSHGFRFIALLVSSALIADWSIRNIGPDLLIAAFILLYLYAVTDPDILKHKKKAFLCGIICGVAYLSKHYALPFFLVHFPAMLLLKSYFERDRQCFSTKNILLSLTAGIAGLLIIATFWFAAISAKFGSFAVSPAGSIVHAMHGPKDMDRRPPSFYGGLNRPWNPEAIHTWEDPVELKDKYKMWSPFDSKEYMMYQLTLIRVNIQYILNHFLLNSPYFIYSLVAGVMIICLVSFFVTRPDSAKRFLYSWVMITFAIHSSGYILTIARSPRRFYPLMLILIFLSMQLLEKLLITIGPLQKGWISEKGKKLLNVFLLILFAMAFALKPIKHIGRTMDNIISLELVNPYMEIAGRLDSIDITSPYAMIRSSQKPHTDLYIAYYLGKQYLGRPLSSDVKGILEELQAAGADTLIVFDNHEIMQKIKQDQRFRHIASKMIQDDRYNDVVNINIRDHEISGWDKEVNVFRINPTK